jgi:hypothetical protein
MAGAYRGRFDSINHCGIADERWCGRCTGDSDCHGRGVAATDTVGYGNGSSSHADTAANWHAVATTFSHADAGTGHFCANSVADPTNQWHNGCSIIDPSTHATAGHTWSDRNGSTDATDRNAYGNHRSANRYSNHTAVTATADGASCNATTTGANRAQ